MGAVPAAMAVKLAVPPIGTTCDAGCDVKIGEEDVVPAVMRRPAEFLAFSPPIFLG